MFKVQEYYLLSNDPEVIQCIATLAGVKPVSDYKVRFYDSSLAYKRIKRAGLINLFDVI